MKEPVFTGSCTAMITPFSQSGLDLRRMGELLDFQEKNGTAAVLIAGTTGESPTLESHEYEELVAFSVQHVNGRMKVLVGAGGNNTLECLRKAQKAADAGADCVMMSVPYYNKSTQAGLVEHFTYVADRISLPMILYNVPSRTVVGISLDTYRQLAQHPNINGVKEASGDFSLIGKLAATCGGSLNLWSGNDDQTLPMMALGAQGVISVASNIVPETVAILCSLCRSGDYKAAAQLYYRYAALFSGLFLETNPIPVKAAMKLMGLDSGLLRLPLLEMSPAAADKLRRILEELGLLS